MRIVDAASRPLQPVAIPAISVVGACATILALPSLGAQLAAVGAALLLLATVVYARSGLTPNAVWIIVLGILLFDPLSVLFTSLRVPVSLILVIPALPVPFVLLGLWHDRSARERVLRLAPLVGLAIVAGLSLGWSTNPGYGLGKFGAWILTGVVPAAAILVLASPARPPSWRILILAAVAYASVLLATGTTSIYPGRLTFFDGNPIWMARVAYIGAIAVLFGPVPWILRGVLLVPLLVAGHLTDSLGPTVGLALGVGAGLMESLRVAPDRPGRARLRLSAAVVVVVMGVVVGGAVVADEPARLTPLLVDPNVSSRAAYLQSASGMFLASPLLGAGFGSFAALGLVDPYPHNLFAEVAAELGIAGLVMLVAWLVIALRAAAGSPLMVALVIATLVFAQFSGNVAGNTELWLVSALAVAMASRRERRADTARGKVVGPDDRGPADWGGAASPSGARSP